VLGTEHTNANVQPWLTELDAHSHWHLIRWARNISLHFLLLWSHCASRAVYILVDIYPVVVLICQ